AGPSSRGPTLCSNRTSSQCSGGPPETRKNPATQHAAEHPISGPARESHPLSECLRLLSSAYGFGDDGEGVLLQDSAPHGSEHNLVEGRRSAGLGLCLANQKVAHQNPPIR